MLVSSATAFFLANIIIHVQLPSVSSLAVSISSTVISGQAAPVSWNRNSPSDPTSFILRPRNLGQPNGPVPPEVTVNAGSQTKGQMPMIFDSVGTYLIETFKANGDGQSLGATSTFKVTPQLVASSSSSSISFPQSTRQILTTASSFTVLTTAIKPSSTARTSTSIVAQGDNNPLATITPDPLPSAASGFLTIIRTTSTSTTSSLFSPSAALDQTPPRNIRTSIIVGSVFGVIIFIGLATLLLIWLIQRSRARSKRNTATFFRDMMIRSREEKLAAESTATSSRERIIDPGPAAASSSSRYPFSSYSNSQANRVSDQDFWVDEPKKPMRLTRKAPPPFVDPPEAKLSPISLDMSSKNPFNPPRTPVSGKSRFSEVFVDEATPVANLPENPSLPGRF